MKYRYRTDEEMKDSGVKWIGKIPKNVEIIKLKFISEFINGYAFKSDDLTIEKQVPVIRIGDINEKGIDISRTLKTNINNELDLKQYSIKLNDILIAMSGATVGKTMFINTVCRALINQRVGIIRSCDIQPKFLYWSISNNKFKEEISVSSVGGAQENISSVNIENNYIVNFNEHYQQKIVLFLEEKTSQFDSIISKKESLIEKLEEAKKSLISEVVTGKVKVVKTEEGYDIVPRKPEEMKDSGVEWLGLVPKEWDITKLKMLVKSIGRGKSPDYVEDSNVRVLNQACIYWEFLNLDNVKFQNEEINYSRARLERGDLLINSTGTGTLGRANIFNEEGEFIADSHVTVVSCKDKNYSKYLRYVIRTDLYQNLIYSTMVTGSTNQIELSRDGLRNMLVLKMSNEELILIIKYLEYRIKQVEIVLYRTIKQIQKLKEAKQSLITEAVTGKIKILD